MSLYAIALSLHVITAILGLGQVTALGVVASAGAPESWAALRRLAIGSSLSLGVMFLTGALIEFATGGSYHRTLWFKLSVALFVVVGALLGRTRGMVRKQDVAVLPGVVRMTWTMGIVIAAIAVLMELKPW